MESFKRILATLTEGSTQAVNHAKMLPGIEDELQKALDALEAL